MRKPRGRKGEDETFEHEGGRVFACAYTRWEATTGGVPQKKIFLKISQNLQENRSQGCNSIKKETPTQVFSCEFCDFFADYLFYRTTLGRLLLYVT